MKFNDELRGKIGNGLGRERTQEEQNWRALWL
jgi:hypothetical protein